VGSEELEGLAPAIGGPGYSELAAAGYRDGDRRRISDGAILHGQDHRFQIVDFVRPGEGDQAIGIPEAAQIRGEDHIALSGKILRQSDNQTAVL